MPSLAQALLEQGYILPKPYLLGNTPQPTKTTPNQGKQMQLLVENQGKPRQMRAWGIRNKT